MLSLSLRPGDYVDIGTDIRVIFTGGMPGNIHLLIDAPKERRISRSLQEGAPKRKKVTDAAQKEIQRIIWEYIQSKDSPFEEIKL